jgi:hypothetical protein
MPVWRTRALDGLDPGFNVASVQDLVDALDQDRDQQTRRDRYRYVFVLMVVGDDVRPHAQGSGSGVFLTQQDAETAQAILAPQGPVLLDRNAASCRVTGSTPSRSITAVHKKPRMPVRG